MQSLKTRSISCRQPMWQLFHVTFCQICSHGAAFSMTKLGWRLWYFLLWPNYNLSPWHALFYPEDQWNCKLHHTYWQLFSWSVIQLKFWNSQKYKKAGNLTPTHILSYLHAGVCTSSRFLSSDTEVNLFPVLHFFLSFHSLVYEKANTGYGTLADCERNILSRVSRRMWTCTRLFHAIQYILHDIKIASHIQSVISHLRNQGNIYFTITPWHQKDILHEYLFGTSGYFSH